MIMALILMSQVVFGESIITKTLAIQSQESDGYCKLYNGAGNITSTYAYVGDGYLVGWRFENVPIPPGAEVIEAVLEIFCNTRNESPINVVYRGEASDNSKSFSTNLYDMVYRSKTVAEVMENSSSWRRMGWNKTPDLATIVQEIVNRPGWLPRNALTIFAVDEESTDKRSVYMSENGYGARLTLTYIVSTIEFDTNGDGQSDITMVDNDGDGYFECPVGKTEYAGRLVIDKPVEIMGDQATRVETLFKGSEFILTDGGEIISDLLSPVVSGSYPNLKGNDLQIVANNLLQIEYGAKILLGGDSDGNWAGDVYFEVTRPGADLFVKENSFISGRHIDFISNGGPIHVRTGSSILGYSHINFRAENGGDIHLNRDVSISTSSIEGECWLTFNIENGDLHMNRNIELSADIIDLCHINGNIWDDGTVSVVGENLCP